MPLQVSCTGTSADKAQAASARKRFDGHVRQIMAMRRHVNAAVLVSHHHTPSSNLQLLAQHTQALLLHSKQQMTLLPCCVCKTHTHLCHVQESILV